MAQTTGATSFKDCAIHLTVPIATTITEPIASNVDPANDGTVTLASTTGFPATGWILIDSELLKYKAVASPTTLTLAAAGARGSDGTTAASHLDNAVCTFAWTDISGFANEVTVSGGDRATGEAFTFDGDTPIVTAGKRSALDVTVKAVYTEGVAEPQEMIRAAYEAGSVVNVQWMPKGNTQNNFRYATHGGYVTSHAYPSGSASSADAVPLTFTIKVETITKSAVP